MHSHHQADEDVNVRPATPADLNLIRHLAKRYSNQLGFVPGAALAWYVEHGHCLIVTENGDAAGYVLGRPSLRFDRRIRGLTQTAISFDAQRRRLGAALVDTFALTSRLNGRDILQAWCAEDIEANKFWPAVGFTAVATRKPDNARGRQLILWRKMLTRVRIPAFFEPPPVAGFRAARTTAVQRISGLDAILADAAVAHEEATHQAADADGRSWIVSDDGVTAVPPLPPGDGRLFDPTDAARPFRG